MTTLIHALFMQLKSLLKLFLFQLLDEVEFIENARRYFAALAKKSNQHRLKSIMKERKRSSAKMKRKSYFYFYLFLS